MLMGVKAVNSTDSIGDKKSGSKNFPAIYIEHGMDSYCRDFLQITLRNSWFNLLSIF